MTKTRHVSGQVASTEAEPRGMTAWQPKSGRAEDARPRRFSTALLWQLSCLLNEEEHPLEP